jgi:tetratricopeptide (TPR) repeat protein
MPVKRSAAAPVLRKLTRPRGYSRALLTCLLCLGACSRGSAPPSRVALAPTPTHAPGDVEVPRTIVGPNAVTDIPEIYQQATRAGQAHAYGEAARGFERAYSLDPDGPLAPSALFESAEMLDVDGEREPALARYEQLVRRFPQHELARVAAIRALRLLTFLERYQRAGELARWVLENYATLPAIDRIVALSARALERVAADDSERAEYFIEKGREIVEGERLDAMGRLPSELAELYYALGEAKRLRAEKIRFVPTPENFAAVLEQRCQLLLDAQSGYSDAMRAYDAHWSAMAGFRVGELYQRLHADLMAVTPPKSADTERRRQLFEGAMRLRYAILLDKAKAMMDHTLLMASRTGERSSWVERSVAARDAIARAMDDEKIALSRLPYTREQLQSALDSFTAGRAP